jgi:hypothetical protein
VHSSAVNKENSQAKKSGWQALYVNKTGLPTAIVKSAK